MSLVVVGDSLLDRDVHGRAERLAPDAPAPVVDECARRARPGGAALAAALAARDGRPVTLISALAGDGAGAELRDRLDAFGVTLVDLGLPGTTPEKIRIGAGGQVLVRLDRGDGGRPGPLTRAARRALQDADAVLVSDYGRGLAGAPGVRAALTRLRPDAPLVWDPHPRGAAPVPGVRVATPNAAEAARLVPQPGDDAIVGDAVLDAAEPARPEPDRDVARAAARGRALARRWRAVAVCVTLGDRGAALAFADGAPLIVPAVVSRRGDPCGAGDRFAAALAARLADGELPSDAVAHAVASASRFVAAGGAAALSAPGEPADADATRGGADDDPDPDPVRLAARVRAAGGTVVATGGCFDLLHAGHAAMLAAARALGDCLIVCLNSDASVRRLKGDGRPLVAAADRAALLRALGCVDATAVFDEDVPERVLRALRPHLFVKGGDYHALDLPEAATLAEWGGHAVTVPFMAGRSTTRIVEEAMAHGA